MEVSESNLGAQRQKKPKLVWQGLKKSKHIFVVFSAQCRVAFPEKKMYRFIARPFVHLRSSNVARACFSTTPSCLHKANARKRLQGTGAVPQRAGLANDKQIYLDWNAKKTSVYHHFWLRDHCRCEQCYHPQTRQRLVDTFAIPRDIQPTSVDSTPEGLAVIWPDGHQSLYAWDWLHTHSYSPVLRTSDPLESKQPQLWDASLNLPAVDHEEVMHSKEGLAKWLNNLEVYGIAFVDNTPTTIEATEALGRRLCYLRETHYDRGMWSIQANLHHADTAYTTLGLGAHTDNTYFTEPAGLQMFHKLEFNGKGGESLFVDGFNVAKQLKALSPEAYRTLSTTHVPTHSAGDDDILIVPTPRAYPILNHDPNGRLYQVRYNNNDRSALDHLSSAQLEAFYDALFMWSKLLKDKKNELWEPLNPGRVVIFDNWRVLHGRAAFEGHRLLCGAYFPWDDYKSRARTVRLTSEDKDRLL
ncbi:trimethyllysine dioxygenase [Radiomyces spectabilis]|uniref:trimethyllysine dioxygenase n=1 Tax=Radiomyces spectabilis TaxID=64574 RepID=UPI00221F996C|nr:trimethyllysine dioxygenase [Radiomyces spectabilis]KAI8377561.1 trimethyllysine dioxygenase [Radiomyces spectabilis]